MNIYLWLLYFWTVLILSIFPYLIYLLLRLTFNKKVYESYANICVKFWGKIMLLGAGVKLNVIGLENIPDTKRMCFISNHQSYLDILVMLCGLPKPVGFIAKNELKYIPVLHSWMKTFKCLFINRKKTRKAIKTIQQAIQNVKEGYPQLIFPEGTRSKSIKPLDFKVGSFQLPIKAKATIIPLTIKNSFEFYEKENKIIHGTIDLIIHKPITPNYEDKVDKQRLCSDVKATIVSELDI